MNTLEYLIVYTDNAGVNHKTFTADKDLALAEAEKFFNQGFYSAVYEIKKTIICEFEV